MKNAATTTVDNGGKRPEHWNKRSFVLISSLTIPNVLTAALLLLEDPEEPAAAPRPPEELEEPPKLPLDPLEPPEPVHLISTCDRTRMLADAFND